MSKSPLKVAIGLSGGVDSAVAAHLLLEQGFSVTGIFMKNWDEDDGTDYCTATQDLEDAERVANKLKIELLAINFASEYWDLVFAEFLHEYEHGRTPNPDVLCNRHIKFDMFDQYARSLGVDAIATGHYATSKIVDGRFQLFRAEDKTKDQTYFLQAVPINRLEGSLFPLATINKKEVRKLAFELGLHLYDKKDSTGICFIGERRFRDFLGRFVKKQPGEVHTTQGLKVGEHIGLAYYTIGQRKGIGIGGVQLANEAPWYVVAKNQEENLLIVSQDLEHLNAPELIAEDPNWFVDTAEELSNISAMTRYRQRPESCSVALEDEIVRVRFDKPQRAITPGQYVAFYQNERCLGGAKIKQSIGGIYS